MTERPRGANLFDPDDVARLKAERAALAEVDVRRSRDAGVAS